MFCWHVNLSFTSAFLLDAFALNAYTARKGMGVQGLSRHPLAGLKRSLNRRGTALELHPQFQGSVVRSILRCIVQRGQLNRPVASLQSTPDQQIGEPGIF